MDIFQIARLCIDIFHDYFIRYISAISDFVYDVWKQQKKKMFSRDFIYIYIWFGKTFNDFWQINFCTIARALCFRICYKITVKKKKNRSRIKIILHDSKE